MPEEIKNTMPVSIDKEGNPFPVSDLSKEKTIATSNGSGRFTVRVNIDGLLYDPKDHNTTTMTSGKAELSENKYALKPCSAECFRYYTTYLRTKNHTHMVIAQREYSNG